MSENNLISDDKMNQEILKQKSLSYKKKLVYSKYKNNGELFINLILNYK